MVDTAQGCRILLLELYNLSHNIRKDEHILFPEQVSAVLQMTLQDTIPVIGYLEQSGYIKCGRPVDRPYSWVKLSQPGMELVRDNIAFEKEFPDATTSAAGSKMDASVHAAPTVEQPELSHDGANSTSDQYDVGKHHSLAFIIQSLRQGDDQPLREFLSILILEGGMNTTLNGVKALLEVTRNET